MLGKRKQQPPNNIKKRKKKKISNLTASFRRGGRSSPATPGVCSWKTAASQSRCRKQGALLLERSWGHGETLPIWAVRSTSEDVPSSPPSLCLPACLTGMWSTKESKNRGDNVPPQGLLNIQNVNLLWTCPLGIYSRVWLQMPFS